MNLNSLLIVDDEPAIRTLVARLAESRGYQITEAACAGEALDRMAEHQAAIAVCDIGMPDRDGLWLTGQLRHQFPDTAVIIVTGYGNARREASLEQGAIGYLSKPFTREELVGTLEQAARWHDERMTAVASERSRLGRPVSGLIDAVQLEPAVKTPAI
jgi:CheY-like chemotaxis protein